MFLSIIAKLIHTEPCEFCSVATQLKKGCESCLVYCPKKAFGKWKTQNLDPERNTVLYNYNSIIIQGYNSKLYSWKCMY